MKPRRFIVTTGASGVRLSLAGEWGNRAYPSVEAAEAEARRIGGAGASITRERGR